MRPLTYYEGAHAIAFSSLDDSATRNTWEDWYLIPVSRPTMSIPGAQSKFVEIPGMDGSYDISDYLRSDTAFADRSGSFEFAVDNDHAEWLTIYRSIVTFLHGQRLKMILTDDPEWYYVGRFTVDEWKSEPSRSKITISYRVAPFKYSIYADFAQNVLWDPFCFERDMDYSVLYHIQLNNETRTYDIEGYGVRNVVLVKLVSGSGGTASFGGVTKQVNTTGAEVTLGTGSRIGTDPLTITGTGVFDVGWRKASL